MKKSKVIRKIRRECIVCGKRLRIVLYQDGHYRNAQYFGKFKLPIKGTGEYKKTRNIKIGRKKYDVVDWTGKEKEIEYWECNHCFEEAMHENWLEQMLEKLYGKRCKDYEKNCANCEAWSVYDIIIDSNRGKL